MKVSILTLHNVLNYGSALQTFATQEVFHRFNLKVEIIDFQRKDINNIYKNNFSLDNSSFLKFFISVIKLPYRILSTKKKLRIFKNFLDKNINLSNALYLDNKDFEKYPVVADIYCIGSDQVWNFIWNQGFIEPFYLGFAPENSFKMSFSSSFGRKKIPEHESRIIKPYMLRFDSISVREKSGVDILKKIGIRETISILDPTLMLNNKDWFQFCNNNPFPDEPYLLVYQLNNNKFFDNIIKIIAKAKGLKIIKITLELKKIFNKDTIVCPSVDKWLTYFYHASYVITDSFHGTVFSVNFNKQFCVIAPPKFSDRLTNILSITDLENRIIDNQNQIDCMLNTDIDYSKVNKIIQQERNKAHIFLERSIIKAKVLNKYAE
ncbi:MAG: polysaccharide pyruvyl transferase family protein [Coriobacteriia bacterium]|nr:polysaccharide pyruvyl transferase family protein [Coriobacteriia bacterium]